MKKMIQTLFAVGALCAVLAVTPSAQGASCGTAASPTPCSGTIGGLTLDFSSFTFFSTLSGVGAGTQIAANEVNIDLILGTDSWTIQLTPSNPRQDPNPWLFTGTQLQQMFVGYQVTMTGTGSIVGIGAGFTDVFTGSNNQFGSGSQTKDVCTGGPCGGGGTTVSSVNLNDQLGTAGVQGSYSGSTAPVFGQASPSVFYVRDTMNLQANNQSVEGFEFSNTFNSDVPEPEAFVLIGLGLIGISAMRRHGLSS